MAVLEARDRAAGPPSLLSWILTMSGYSAAAQGDQQRADRLFDESASIEVPERTHSRNKPNEAMAAFRRGDRPRGLRILRSDVHDLIEDDSLFDMAGTAIAFFSLMVQLGHDADAARMQGYLEKTGRTEILRSVVEQATARLAASDTVGLDRERALGRALDAHQALDVMRATLDELLV